MWLKIIGAAIVLVGVILIFDARNMTRKYFSMGEENITVLGIKIFGTLLVLVGGILNVI